MATHDAQRRAASSQARSRGTGEFNVILCIVSFQDLLSGYKFAVQQVDKKGNSLGGTEDFWKQGSGAKAPNTTGMVAFKLSHYGAASGGINVWAYKDGLKGITGFSPIGLGSLQNQYYLVTPLGPDRTIARSSQSTDTTTAPSRSMNFGFTGSVGTGSESPVNVQGGANLGFTRNGEQRSNAQQQGVTETESTRVVKSLGVVFYAGPPSFSAIAGNSYA